MTDTTHGRPIGSSTLGGVTGHAGPPGSARAYERSVLAFRSEPGMRDFVEKNYLDEDLEAASRRYCASTEFADLCARLQPQPGPGTVLLDLGSGRGLTSLAFATHGALVVSVEEDPSDLVGVGALARSPKTDHGHVVAVRGDILQLPFGDDSFDIVFCRGVLHHLSSIDRGLSEMFRVLKRGGQVLAAGEHIVALWSNRSEFLASHPAVRYGVNEYAYPSVVYFWALCRAGFRSIRFFGYPLTFDTFVQELTRSGRLRSRLATLPVIGSMIARGLHAAHVLVRRHLFVPERYLPAISMIATKP